jgi:WD40 repeat protein
VYDTQDDGALIQEIQGHQGWANDVKYSPCGRLLASSGDDGVVVVYSVDNWSVLATLKGRHTERVRDVCFNLDGSNIVSASIDRTAVVWNIQTQSAITVLPHPDQVPHPAYLLYCCPSSNLGCCVVL